MEAEILKPDLRFEVSLLEEIEADYTAYRLALDETVDPKEPLGYIVQSPFDDVEEEPVPEMLWDKYLVEPFLDNIAFKKGIIPPQRWTPDGSRCFYSALERETAIAEVAHYIRKRLADLSARAAAAHYVKFSIEFHGKILDVHALTAKHPELVYDQHHPNCHLVGEAAKQRGSDGILAPSVRCEGGKCLAVYVRQALKPGEFLERIIFSRSPSGEVITKRAPYRPDELAAKPPEPQKKRGRLRAA